MPSRRSTKNIRTLAIAASSDAESFSMTSATRSICGCCQPCSLEPARGGQVQRRHEQRRHHRVQGGEPILAGVEHPVGPRLEVGDVGVRACRWRSLPGWGRRVSMRNQALVRVETERAVVPEDQRLIASGQRVPASRSSGGSRCRPGGRARPAGAAPPTSAGGRGAISSPRQVRSSHVQKGGFGVRTASRGRSSGLIGRGSCRTPPTLRNADDARGVCRAWRAPPREQARGRAARAKASCWNAVPSSPCCRAD